MPTRPANAKGSRIQHPSRVMYMTMARLLRSSILLLSLVPSEALRGRVLQDAPPSLSPTITPADSDNALPGAVSEDIISWLGEDTAAAITTAASTSGTGETTSETFGATTDENGMMPAKEDAATTTNATMASTTTATAHVEGTVTTTTTILTDPTDVSEFNDIGSNVTDNPLMGGQVSTASASSVAASSNATSTLDEDSPIDNTLTASTTSYMNDSENNTSYNKTIDEYTGMDDEYTAMDDELDEYYDDDENESWPWEDTKQTGPTDQPTPRPTYHAYTSPTDDVLETSSTIGEFDDDLQTNKFEDIEEKVKAYLDGVESPEEMGRDVNVQVVAGVLSLVFLFMWLITAWQTMENPDGLCASFCRLILKFVCCVTRVLFLPCHYMCCKETQQSMGRRSHAPMRAPFPSDFELS